MSVGPLLDGLAGLSATTIVLAIGIMTVGSALQAAVGMGLGLFVVPLLVLLDDRFVPGPLLVGAMVLALGMARREHAAIEWSGLGVAVAGLLLGTAIGATALTLVDVVALPRVFGGLILLAVVLSVSGVRVAPNGPALLAGGTVAGVMGSMVGIHGPPIALVLQHASPSRLRAMLAGFFVVGYIAGVFALSVAGLFSTEQWAFGLLLVPGAVAGYLVGPFLARRLDPRRLRAAILLISGVSAVSLLLR